MAKWSIVVKSQFFNVAGSVSVFNSKKKILFQNISFSLKELFSFSSEETSNAYEIPRAVTDVISDRTIPIIYLKIWNMYCVYLDDFVRLNVTEEKRKKKDEINNENDRIGHTFIFVTSGYLRQE